MKVKVKSLSHVRLLATPWTAAYQAPPSMGFSRQEYWSGHYLLLLYICLTSENSFLTTLLLLIINTKKGKQMNYYAYPSWTLLEDCTGESNGTPLQYSCLENPWTEEPGRLQSMGHYESDTTE